MILEEMMQQERKEGMSEDRQNAILELLEDFGSISEEIKSRIKSESNMEVLKLWHKKAAKASSLEEFLNGLK